MREAIARFVIRVGCAILTGRWPSRVTITDHLEVLTGAQDFEALRQAVCEMLHRLSERVDEHTLMEAYGLLGGPPIPTDFSEACAAVRRAARLCVVKRDDGYFDFVSADD